MLCFRAEPKNNLVVCEVKSGLRIEKPLFYFHWHCNSDHEAALLAQHLDKELGAAVENARQQAYTQGYKDGRARRRKKTCIAVLLDAECPGVW